MDGEWIVVKPRRQHKVLTLVVVAQVKELAPEFTTADESDTLRGWLKSNHMAGYADRLLALGVPNVQGLAITNAGKLQRDFLVVNYRRSLSNRMAPDHRRLLVRTTEMEARDLKTRAKRLATRKGGYMPHNPDGCVEDVIKMGVFGKKFNEAW